MITIILTYSQNLSFSDIILFPNFLLDYDLFPPPEIGSTGQVSCPSSIPSTKSPSGCSINIYELEGSELSWTSPGSISERCLSKGYTGAEGGEKLDLLGKVAAFLGMIITLAEGEKDGTGMPPNTPHTPIPLPRPPFSPRLIIWVFTKALRPQGASLQIPHSFPEPRRPAPSS